MGKSLRFSTREGEQKCRQWPCVRSVNRGSCGFKIKEQTASVQFAHLPQHHSHNTSERNPLAFIISFTPALSVSLCLYLYCNLHHHHNSPVLSITFLISLHFFHIHTAVFLLHVTDLLFGSYCEYKKSNRMWQIQIVDILDPIFTLI